MACLNESELLTYLEEADSTPGNHAIGNHLAACAGCRSRFDRALDTRERVDRWLSALSSPGENPTLEVDAALGRVLQRAFGMSADDHLARLLPPETAIPWHRSAFANLRDLVRPAKLPPLTLRSKPVAVREIWSERTNPRAIAWSVLLQGTLVASLFLVGTTATVRKAVTNVLLMAPPPPKAAAPKTNSGGGGGSRSPLPPVKAQLPRPAPKQFVPPLVTIEKPALVMDASLIAPPDAWAAPTGAIGNPLGQIGGGGGLGSGGGIGNVRGNGIGSGNGSGFGNGSGGGAYSVGNGVTAPSVLSKVDPEYSEEARKAKYSGEVLLSIVVNTDGKAENITLVRSLGMGLDEKAIEAVQKWRFIPGKKAGVPVRVKAQIAVNFRLL
jgi:TonB family protein